MLTPLRTNLTRSNVVGLATITFPVGACLVLGVNLFPIPIVPPLGQVPRLWTGQQRRQEWWNKHRQTSRRKDIRIPLSTGEVVMTQPKTQVVLKGTKGEMEPATSPDDVVLTLQRGSLRL